MPLVFAPAELPTPLAPERCDVACFIGFVHRRAGTALSAAQWQGLREAGWLDGPSALPAPRLAALDQVPVVVDSFSEFDRLFDSVARPVGGAGADTSGAAGPGADGPGAGGADNGAAASPARCAAMLAAAVRSYFLAGGRRAIILRVGNPWPVLEPVPRNDAERQRQQALRQARLAALLPPGPVDRFEPSGWRGIQHLLGLDQAALLCLPDLPELHALPVPAPDTAPVLLQAPEVFVTCSVADQSPPPDRGLRRLAAPRLDLPALQQWAASLGRVRDFLARHRRDVIALAALPLVADGPGWPRRFHDDPLAALVDAGLLLLPGADAAGHSSALVQLATPWLVTPASQDLPQALVPPDGTLAGTLARQALQRGCFRSAAGTPRPEIIQALPQPVASNAPDHPWSRLAQRLCVLAPGPDGWALQSDVTTSPAAAWRGGQASRLVAAVLRAARGMGQVHTFAANGPALWQQAQRSMALLLTGFWRAGGLDGATSDEAFELRCDRSTMTQADLDAGRLVMTVVLRPAAALDRITVSLSLLSSTQAEGQGDGQGAALLDSPAGPASPRLAATA